MFAGAKIKFIKDIKFNDKATKVSKIKRIEKKGKENNNYLLFAYQSFI